MKKIDSHLHVWAHDPDIYPYKQGQEQPLRARGDAEFLLELMDAADVAGSLIVQPIVHGFDHSYVNHTIAKWPDRFIGMCLVDPQADDPAYSVFWFLYYQPRGHGSYLCDHLLSRHLSA